MVFERERERSIVVQSPLPRRSGAVEKKLVCLVDCLGRFDGWERHNGFVVEEPDVRSSVGASVVDGWIRGHGTWGSCVSEDGLAVDLLIKTISSNAKNVIVGGFVQLNEHGVSTAMGEGHCLENMSGSEQDGLMRNLHQQAVVRHSGRRSHTTT